LTKKILPVVALVALALPASAMAAPKSKFRFSAPTYVTSESQSSIAVTVTRTARHGHSRINQTSSVNWSITGGTATQGVDYSVSPAPGALTFAPGETSKTLTFAINQDSDPEGLESIGLKLSAASNNALITQPRSAQVLIADDDGPQQMQLVAAAPSVSESAATADFYAVRSGDTAADADVDYATSDGTAIQPGDYTSTSGHLHFGSADFAELITVPIGHDSTPEDSETFNMTLSNLQPATVKFPNSVSSVTVGETIVDDDAAPQFALDASSYQVNENGSVDVTVQRLTSHTATAVSANDVFDVAWNTIDGTATNPADYIPGSDRQLEFDATDDAETITIAANDADTQIALIDDALAEGDETFQLALQGASVEAGGDGIAPSLGTPAAAAVTIHDNDAPASNGNGNGSGGGATNGTDTNGTNGGGQTGSAQVVAGARQAPCGLTLKAAKKQKLLKAKSLKLTLKAPKACKLTVATTITQVRPKSHKRQAQLVRALRLKGKNASLTLQPGKAKTVKVKFTKKTLKAITKALRARKNLVATVVVSERISAWQVKRHTLKITIQR
jgi:hypothetical protein